MEASYHLLINNKENNQENMCQSELLHDNIKRKLISETCNGLSADTDRVLNMHTRTFDVHDQNSLLFNSSTNGNTAGSGSSKKVNMVRHVQSTPEKILDAPDFRDDFCKKRFFSFFFTEAKSDLLNRLKIEFFLLFNFNLYLDMLVPKYSLCF